VTDIDRDGLQVAYLDDSGQNDYWLDRETGEVVTGALDGDPRFVLVPHRSAESDAADRVAFVASLKPQPMKETLARVQHDAIAFRELLATDRFLERKWYAFKNDRANVAIEAWLGTL
jgi:hypothetical protein